MQSQASRQSNGVTGSYLAASHLALEIYTEVNIGQLGGIEHLPRITPRNSRLTLPKACAIDNSRSGDFIFAVARLLTPNRG